MVDVFYGPLVFFLPKWASDFIAVAFMTQIHTQWQLVPAPSILQWLSLTSSERSLIRRMIYAYAIPVAMQIWAFALMPNFLPSDELRMEFESKVFRLHGTNLSDFHVYGMNIMDKNHFDTIDFAIFDVLPSYIISYAIFGVSMFKVYSKYCLHYLCSHL
ncbi:hypothetical protein PFISCL1PPCAC_14216 [Pristionchus fissidentatus]|uniref:G protein-coupled receptor n=1 Tax=Pristionchus fissidentatus TaxID=1538716 RepID=A0AAV5VXX7_9BILA|nr:hypothetical protein PFISCL1PPCAC_14216 [Pristionchus fissidentatus]